MKNTHETQTEVIEALQDYKKYSAGICMEETCNVMKQIKPLLKSYEGEGIRLTTAMAFSLGTRHGVKQERARRKDNDFISQMDNRQAKIELNDELFELGQKISRAQLLISEVTDKYFGKHDSSKKENVWRIAHDFNRHGEFSEMVFDYILEAQKIINELTDIKYESEPGEDVA